MKQEKAVNIANIKNILVYSDAKILTYNFIIFLALQHCKETNI